MRRPNKKEKMKPIRITPAILSKYGITQKTRRKMSHGEDDLQISCVEWFKYQYPHLELIHIPNGGKRNQFEGERFKKMGVRKGALDLLLLEPNKGYHGLWIEMKFGKNKMSKEQKDFSTKMIQRGYGVVEVRTFEQFQECILKYLL